MAMFESYEYAQALIHVLQSTQALKFDYFYSRYHIAHRRKIGVGGRKLLPTHEGLVITKV